MPYLYTCPYRLLVVYTLTNANLEAIGNNPHKAA